MLQRHSCNQRHLRDTPSSSHHDTTSPTQSHSATHATRREAISIAQRHSRPRAVAISMMQLHFATRLTAISIAQRHLRHTRDASETQISTAQHPCNTSSCNSHGTAPPTPHATRLKRHHTICPRTTHPKHRSAWHGIDDALRVDTRETQRNRAANEVNMSQLPDSQTLCRNSLLGIRRKKRERLTGFNSY